MNYKESYYQYYGLDKCDFLACEYCLRPAVDLHHLKSKGQCGTDHPLNLMPLCRKCHKGHHDNNKPNTKQLIDAHNKYKSIIS